MTTWQRIKEITERIVEEIHPKRIYLFGSQARGTPDEWSDIDLLVIADIPGPKHKRSLAIHRLFPDRDFAMDVVVRTEAEFEAETEIPNTLGQIVAQEGKLLYAGKRQWVKKWLTKAENDLRTAEAAMALNDPPSDTICFHAQQCIEKCLKAFLTHHEISVKKTHDLVKLNNLCSGVDPDFAQLVEVCILMTPYAVEARYPDDFNDYPVEEAKEAIEAARKVRDFVLEKLSEDK